MKYYRKKNGEYIATVGVVTDGEECTMEEYEAHIEEVMRNLPDPDPTAEEMLSELEAIL